MILRLERFFHVSSPLLQHVRNVTSQFGEDGILAHIINTIQPASRYCVEFGAWDGIRYSNCHNLLVTNGWRGLMIEAQPDKFSQLVSNLSRYQNIVLANRFVDFEGPNSLDSILKEENAPQSFGLLSIDIDGNDYYVWESLKDYTPEIVVIEFNPTVPNDVVFVQDKSFDANQGCSLLALVLLGKQKGYELAVATKINAVFVRADKYPLLGINNNFIANLYAPMQDGRIFHGYDGTIHVVGFNKLLWGEQRAVSSADFQIVEKRGWKDAVTPPPDNP
jgi:hypothetical protein